MKHANMFYIRQKWSRTLAVFRALAQILKLILAILQILKQWF
jgi:hypothetical protein